MNNFIKNNIIVILIILSLFYYFYLYNKKIIENMSSTTQIGNVSKPPDVDISNIASMADQIINKDNSNLILPFNNIEFKNKVNVTNELIIGNITLRDENGVLVITKPIKIDEANIGKWKIRQNKIGVTDSSDIIIDKQDIHFVDYNTDAWSKPYTAVSPIDYNPGKYSKIYTENIKTSEISIAKELNRPEIISKLPVNEDSAGTISNAEDASYGAILLNVKNIETPYINKKDTSGNTLCGLQINTKEVICRGMKMNTLNSWERTQTDSNGSWRAGTFTGTF